MPYIHCQIIPCQISLPNSLPKMPYIHCKYILYIHGSGQPKVYTMPNLLNFGHHARWHTAARRSTTHDGTQQHDAAPRTMARSTTHDGTQHHARWHAAPRMMARSTTHTMARSTTYDGTQQQQHKEVPIKPVSPLQISKHRTGYSVTLIHFLLLPHISVLTTKHILRHINSFFSRSPLCFLFALLQNKRSVSLYAFLFYICFMFPLASVSFV